MSRISRWDTTWSMDQSVAPPTSMYSMNRGSTPALPRELQQIHHLVLVVAADHHRVQLDGREARGVRRIDAGDHVGVPAAAGELLHSLGTQRVETDRHPTQPRRAEGRRFAGPAAYRSS